METRFLQAWKLGLLTVSLPFVGACFEESSKSAAPASASIAVNRDTIVASAAETSVATTNETAPNELLSPSTNNPVPPDLNISSDLAEIIKLAQAGVSEEVMMAYITNFVHVFELGANEIIYLNDLGVPSAVVTAMIQQDTSPESAARKLASQTKPLSRGLALTSPATNVYPTQQSITPPTEETALEPAAEVPPAVDYAASDYAPQPAAVTYFYNSLAPYGNWVDVGGYGLCWQPTAACLNPNWRPYCDRGRWVYSDCGWYWLSDYSWGWAPFHYGRWVSHANHGWVWSPDHTWGPAWVSWRYSNAYCGWAPLPPEACYTAGVGFTYRSHSVGFGFEFGLTASHYSFLPFDRFCDYSPSRHILSPVYVKNVYNQTKFVNKIRVKGNNNTIINEGIDPAHVAAITRTEIRKVAIRDAQPAAGKGTKHDRLEKEGNTLVVYRPQLPPSSSTRPVASGGREKAEHRDRAAGATKRQSADLAATSGTAISGVSGSGRTRLSHDSQTTLRPSAQGNFKDTTASPETEKPRVTVNRSGGGLTIRGEPRRQVDSTTIARPDVAGKKSEVIADVKANDKAQAASPLVFGSEPRRRQNAPATETSSGSAKIELNRAQNGNESPRSVGTQKQLQPRNNAPQVRTIAPAQPAAAPATQPRQAERPQPRSFRPEQPAPQTVPARPQYNAPVQTPSQPVYSPPARPQYNPAPSQPNRAEPRNYSRPQPQYAQSEPATRSAPPSFAPPAAPQQAAPAPQPSQRDNSQRGNSRPSSQNSDKGDRKR